MEPFKEGEWVILHQLNKKKLARIERKGFATLGKDFVSLEGAIGSLPWTNFKMELHSGHKSGKRMFRIVPLEEDDNSDLDPCDHDQGALGEEEDRDNRTINDDGQSQSLSSTEIEALREGGLTGKEIVNHLIANSSTYDRKTRYAKSKYLKKKESKHCLREKISIRRTTLSSVTEVLCSGGGGEGSRGSISGMRLDTLSQMLTALNIQWKRIPSVKQKPASQIALNAKKKGKASVDVNARPSENSAKSDCGTDMVELAENKGSPRDDSGLEKTLEMEVDVKGIAPVENVNFESGTTYVVYESGNWGLLVASLLTLLPAEGPRLIHLYPGHGVPCLIAPRALNFPKEKFSMLSSVNIKALLEVLEKGGNLTSDDKLEAKTNANEEYHVAECEKNTEEVINCVFDVKKEVGDDGMMEETKANGSGNVTACGNAELSETVCENRKRKIEAGEEGVEVEILAKKPRWQLEAEKAADLLTSSKADGLIVVASREHPVSIVLSLLPFLAPSRPFVVYCPHREPLLNLYAVLKGWQPWTTNYGKCGGKDGVPRVANLRVMENWLRNYQVLPNRTHPEVNMTPGGGFVLTGTIIDFSEN
ncbi:tRNA (adenine(58)-N(1))-methyltransferase non-catalytic subunit TRM6 [Hetaerina americana]|uniref:tRNA (adenine(58)-N(1))-methyltransferase non-catalytic subunit TRM6 n=1 Tax=Hetaerina americana TaxID=62018 RepID=UPI003A7F511B